MYEKNIEVYMIFNCIRDVWTPHLKLRFYLL